MILSLIYSQILIIIIDNTVDSKNIQMQKCDAYEVAPMARKNLVMEVNPAYGEIHRTV